MTLYTSLVLCYFLAPALGLITQITLDPVTSPSLLAGSSFLVSYSFTANDTTSLIHGRLYPYVDGVQYGAEVGPLSTDSVTNTSKGSGYLVLPWGAATSRTLQLASHDAPTTFTMGMPPPAGSLLSNTVTLAVTPRAPVRAHHPTPGKDTQVTLYTETWFTPTNTNWSPGDSIEAIPMLGRYASVSLDSIRAQAAHMILAGVDINVVDWTNNCWGCASWGDRGVNIQELINATSLQLGVYASLKRNEGWEVPQFVMLLGLNNGPVTPLPTLVEELDFMVSAYLSNASLAGMFPLLDGKPLVLIFDGTGGNHSTFTHANFTIRWMASQLQSGPGPGFARRGIWSWMDGSLQPQIAQAPGGAGANTNEAVTLAPAFFSKGGWLNPLGAAGRSGGLTLLSQLMYVLGATVGQGVPLPSFLNICQWNEFAGAPTGTTTSYTDSYSPDLSNDLEPTSPFACAYQRPGGVKCGGGWGYRGLNSLALLRAALADPATVAGSTLVFMLEPTVGAISNYTGVGVIRVSWVAARFTSSSSSVDMSGAPLLALNNITLPFEVFIDDVSVATLPPPPSPGPQNFNLDVSTLDPRFPHVVRVVALQGSTSSPSDHLTSWPLSFDTVDADEGGGVPLLTPRPAFGSAWVWLPVSQ